MMGDWIGARAQDFQNLVQKAVVEIARLFALSTADPFIGAALVVVGIFMLRHKDKVVPKKIEEWKTELGEVQESLRADENYLESEKRKRNYNVDTMSFDIHKLNQTQLQRDIHKYSSWWWNLEQGILAYGAIAIGGASFLISVFYNYTIEEIIRYGIWALGIFVVGATALDAISTLKKRFDYLEKQIQRLASDVDRTKWIVEEMWSDFKNRKKGDH